MLSIIGLLQLHGNPHLVVTVFPAQIVVCPEVQNLDGKIIFLLILRCGKPGVEDQLEQLRDYLMHSTGTAIPAPISGSAPRLSVGAMLAAYLWPLCARL